MQHGDFLCDQEHHVHVVNSQHIARKAPSKRPRVTLSELRAGHYFDRYNTNNGSRASASLVL